jgi:putative peptidoglycan lipid II flippase
VPAMNPIILNVFMIGALIGGQRIWPGDCVVQAWLQTISVLLSGVVQIAWQWHNARRCELHLRPSLDWRDPAITQIARTMLPMTLGLGVVQLNTFIGTVMAYGLVRSHDGGASVLYFAQRLYQFPLGVFAVAMATAIFPAMSRQVSAGATAEFAAIYRRGIRAVLFEGLPCTVGLILIAQPVVKTLFERGNFDAADSARVVPTLIAYSAGIWAFGVSQIQVRALYALKDPHTPLKIATRMIALNFVGNVVLVLWLEEAGLGWSTTICAVIQVFWLSRALKRSVGRLGAADLVGPILRILLATAAMTVAVLAVDVVLRGHWDVYARRQAVRLLVMTATGGGVFVAAAWLLRCEELREIVRSR